MTRVRIIFWAAVLTHLAAGYLMLQGVDPFHRFFYGFAWWSYILAVSSLNHLRGRNSLLFDRRTEFLSLFFFSTLVWLLFELFNFRLNNWQYTGVPAEEWIRWPGYLVAFGTVLPGIFETDTLFGNLGLLGRVRGIRIALSPALLRGCMLLGSFMLLAVLWQPRLFFPLIWVALIALLDPLVYRLDRRRSYLAQASEGDYSEMLRLMAAGLFCGFLWEFWNFWAGSKWEYTLPYLNFWRVFEMPVFGFLGFPPFALECCVLYQLFRIGSERTAGWLGIRIAALLLAAIASILIVSGIERNTIVDYVQIF